MGKNTRRAVERVHRSMEESDRQVRWHLTNEKESGDHGSGDLILCLCFSTFLLQNYSRGSKSDHGQHLVLTFFASTRRYSNLRVHLTFGVGTVPQVTQKLEDIKATSQHISTLNLCYCCLNKRQNAFTIVSLSRRDIIDYQSVLRRMHSTTLRDRRWFTDNLKGFQWLPGQLCNNVFTGELQRVHTYFSYWLE